MNSIKELHGKAMELAQMALVARNQGREEDAVNYSLQAVAHETRAAELVPLAQDSEPSRSVLFRSAASLAYQAKQYSEAITLVGKGLAGFPPPDICMELLNLLEQVKFDWHLEKIGAELGREEMQLSLAGEDVAPGLIPIKELTERLARIPKLVSKTIENMRKLPYRSAGAPPKEVQSFIPAVSAFAPGSFNVVIKLEQTRGIEQDIFVKAEDVIDDILEIANLIENEKLGELKEKISDDAYRTFYMGEFKQLAPDGKNIKYVGISSSHKRVKLTREKNSIKVEAPRAQFKEPRVEPIEINGLLDMASMRDDNIIGITERSKKQKKYNIDISDGMEELVRSYFGMPVLVKGEFNVGENRVYLGSIELLPE